MKKALALAFALLIGCGDAGPQPSGPTKPPPPVLCVRSPANDNGCKVDVGPAFGQAWTASGDLGNVCSPSPLCRVNQGVETCCPTTLDAGTFAPPYDAGADR